MQLKATTIYSLQEYINLKPYSYTLQVLVCSNFFHIFHSLLLQFGFTHCLQLQKNIIIDPDILKYPRLPTVQSFTLLSLYKKVIKASGDIKTKTFSEAGNWVNDIHIDLMEGLSFKYRIAGNYSWGAKFPV